MCLSCTCTIEINNIHRNTSRGVRKYEIQSCRQFCHFKHRLKQVSLTSIRSGCIRVWRFLPCGVDTLFDKVDCVFDSIYTHTLVMLTKVSDRRWVAWCTIVIQFIFHVPCMGLPTLEQKTHRRRTETECRKKKKKTNVCTVFEPSEGKSNKNFRFLCTCE